MALWQKLLAFFPELAKGNSGAGPSVDWTKGTTQSMTLNAATVTPTFANPPGGCNLALVLTQDGVGGRSVVWPAAVTWIGGTPPVLLSGPGQVSLVNFYFDGTTYFGSLATAGSPQSLLPWTDIAAGTVFQSSSATAWLSCDSTAAQTTVKLDPTPLDGQIQVVRLTGTTQVTPVLVLVQGAGNTVEDVVSPGVFQAASTFLAIQCEIAAWKYDKATKQWKLYEHVVGTATAAINSAAWEIDPVNGSNTNSGAPGSPLKTAAELKRRWQGDLAGARVLLPAITITVTAKTNAPDFSDPWCVLLDVDQLGGGKLILQGDAPTVVINQGTLATASAFARTSASGQITITDAGVADYGPFACLQGAGLFVDTTTGGVGWLYSPATGASANGKISPCFAAQVAGTIGFNTVPIATAAGDRYNVLKCVSIYLGTESYYSTAPAPSAAGATAARAAIYRLHLTRQSDFELCSLQTDETAVIALQECLIDPIWVQIGGCYVINCWMNNNKGSHNTVQMRAVNQGGIWQNGGAYASVLATGTNFGLQILGDYVFDVADGDNRAIRTTNGQSLAAGAALQLGNVSFWSSAGADPALDVAGGSTIRLTNGFGPSAILYGSLAGANDAAHVAENGCLEWTSSQTAVATFQLNNTTFKLNGSANGWAFDPATGLFGGAAAGAPTTVTAAHLDAAVNAPGFNHSAQDPASGARIQRGVQF